MLPLDPVKLDPVKVAMVGDLDDGTAIVVDGDANGTGEDIAVFFSNGRYYAINDVCTHQYASLSEGWIEDDWVECPVHAARFSLCTGKVLTPPATRPEPTHRVELRGDEIWLHPGVPSDCSD